MELREFEERFSTEQQCFDYLFYLRWKDTYCCPRCQYHEMWKIRDYKYKCKNCGYQTTVIAGTLFQDTHIPLNLWFRAIWLVSQKYNTTARELQKELGLGSSHTAQKLLSKIRYAMLRFDLGKLQGTIEVNRRPLRNSASKFLAVAVEVNNQRAGRIKAEIINDSHFESINEFMKNNIEPGSTIQSDCWDGHNQVMNQLYMYKKHMVSYEFPYARKVFEIFDGVSANDTAEKLNTYCALYNGQRTPITFDALLGNAVRLQPMPYAGYETYRTFSKRIKVNAHKAAERRRD